MQQVFGDNRCWIRGRGMISCQYNSSASRIFIFRDFFFFSCMWLGVGWVILIPFLLPGHFLWFFCYFWFFSIKEQIILPRTFYLSLLCWRVCGIISSLGVEQEFSCWNNNSKLTENSVGIYSFNSLRQLELRRIFWEPQINNFNLTILSHKNWSQIQSSSEEEITAY